MSLVHGDVPICFEEHHCERTAGLHIADDVFSKDVEAEVDVSRCVDDTDRERPKYGDDKADNESPP